MSPEENKYWAWNRWSIVRFSELVLCSWDIRCLLFRKADFTNLREEFLLTTIRFSYFILKKAPLIFIYTNTFIRWHGERIWLFCPKILWNLCIIAPFTLTRSYKIVQLQFYYWNFLVHIFLTVLHFSVVLRNIFLCSKFSDQKTWCKQLFIVSLVLRNLLCSYLKKTGFKSLKLLFGKWIS